MIWNVKKIKETESSILIAFSKNVSFDGLIEYDKKTQQFKLVKVASDCDEYYSKRVFQFLYGMMSKNKLTFNPYSIRTG